MRKEKTITLDDRGNKLTFKIREMSATQTEYWILRAIKVLGAAGVKLPGGADLSAAARYLLAHSQEVLADLNVADVRDLFDDLLKTCTRVMGKVEEPVTPESVDDYIEDVRTLWSLKMAALEVCFGFFGNANPSESPHSPQIQLHKERA
jgi:hypothetical protein